MDLEGIDYDFDAPDSDWNYEPSRAELFRQIPAALYTTDADGWLTYYNDAAAELWGFRPVLGKARWCGSWRLYDADGSKLPHEECPMAVALREGRAVRGVRGVLERPDGTKVCFMPYPTPLRDETGAVVAGSNILLEIDQFYRNAYAPSPSAAFSGRSLV
ncbi:MAG: PAS domain-containing protein [Methylobacterium sp.]